jgi:uncharacterized membrane protein YfcA
LDILGWLILAAGGFVAGVVNAVAGGSSFLTFPLLLAAGLHPLAANMTNFVALTPGNIMAMVAYRRELAHVGRRLAVPIALSATGGLIGAELLLWSGEVRFARAVPWLILTSTVLFALGTWLKKRLARIDGFDGASWKKVSYLIQFVLAVYGGYFGAGMGVVLLATLNIFGHEDLHEANAVKNTLITVFSVVGVAVFISAGAISWPHALAVMAGTVIGGFVAIRIARSLPQTVLRHAILVWAAGLTLVTFMRYGG